MWPFKRIWRRHHLWENLLWGGASLHLTFEQQPARSPSSNQLEGGWFDFVVDREWSDQRTTGWSLLVFLWSQEAMLSTEVLKWKLKEAVVSSFSPRIIHGFDNDHDQVHNQTKNKTKTKSIGNEHEHEHLSNEPMVFDVLLYNLDQKRSCIKHAKELKLSDSSPLSPNCRWRYYIR